MNLSDLGCVPMLSCSEHDNEYVGSATSGEFLDKLSDC